MHPASCPTTATVPRSSAAPDASAALTRDLAQLDGLDLHELRALWRQRLRSPPPPALTRPLLGRLLAYRLQARMFGDLHPVTAKILDRIAKDEARRRTGANRPKPKAVPPVPPVPKDTSLKPGTLLVREHGGVLHKVTVLSQGYGWNRSTYASLSEVARAITGTRWNGPRFFGLRDKAAAASAVTQPGIRVTA